MTNPIDVVKIRMQLESELAEQKGLTHLKGRYYDGWLKGCARIVKDEGIAGLYKGLGFECLIQSCVYYNYSDITL